ncbi:hypothetical protein D3C78_1759660 [compost metagenome]
MCLRTLLISIMFAPQVSSIWLASDFSASETPATGLTNRADDPPVKQQITISRAVTLSISETISAALLMEASSGTGWLARRISMC